MITASSSQIWPSGEVTRWMMQQPGKIATSMIQNGPLDGVDEDALQQAGKLSPARAQISLMDAALQCEWSKRETTSTSMSSAHGGGPTSRNDVERDARRDAGNRRGREPHQVDEVTRLNGAHSDALHRAEHAATASDVVSHATGPANERDVQVVPQETCYNRPQASSSDVHLAPAKCVPALSVMADSTDGKRQSSTGRT